MDAYQQPHRFMRPPTPPQPPSSADPHLQHHHYQYPNQQQPPPPPQAPWYNSQFQYHPSQSSPQWAPPPPPPHSDHLPPLPNYAPPTNHPYPAHPHPHYSQFPPPPRPNGPPPPHPNHQISQSYPQASQEWGNPNWANHQAWEHPVQKNEEDWAARAKAWAEANAAMEMQHPQSQFAPVGRPEEQNRYHEHYPQANDSHYSDIQQPPLPPLSYQQFPHPAAAPHRPPFDHLQDVASISSGLSSYVSDGHLPYTVRDGTLAGDPNALYPHQETTRSSVHQQEVPSSYSSATGKEEATGQNEQAYRSFPLPYSSAQEGQQHMQPILPANGRSVSIEQPFAYGNQSADLSIDLSDQPLDFAPRFNRDHNLHMQSGYAHSDSMGPVRGVDPAAAVTSVHTWTPPVTPGGVYPSIAPVLPSGPQHDPSIGVPSVPGHSAPPFGRFTGPSFHTAIPTAGTPFGLGAGASLHPSTAFPGDAYGVSGVSERPKKASVPNWLREEIIKTKPVITISHEPPEEETQSIEDDGVDKSVRKGDQADSKSIDSSRSTEEEDDDEDYVEAARTTAINHEIKRVLTEVLLKVTDELFDEIATKVLSEDDLTVEVDRNTVASNHVVSPSSPAVPTPKASAKVLIPVKAKGTETESVSGKAGSSTRGDVLGLSNYASDDDDDDGDDDEEIQTSGELNSRKNAVHQQLNSKNQSEDVHVVQNGGSQVQHEEHIGGHTNMEGGPSRASPSKNNHNAGSGQLSGNKEVRELGLSSVDLAHSSQTVSGDRNNEKHVGGGKMLDDTSASMSNDIEGERSKMKSELPGEIVNVKKYSTDDSQGKETRLTSDKNDRHESKRIPVKDFVKEEESGKNRADENRRRHDGRHLKKERTDNGNGLKERTKEQDIKPGRKAKESESRKKSTHSDVKGDRKETERLHRVSADEDLNRKRERTKEKEKEDHRSRHRPATDSSRHKRRRSSSVSSRDKNGKDNSVSHTHGSSDETSDDSKRKLRSRKRSLSPSPVRSRRRGVSRSPHSKHSVRRHSPYSSLETPRGRRSRSKSPVRRHR